ncbi:MAG: MerR family DNA-binding protein, partial [Myxococcales bacterium]|nr:MerR family DNA-binding protein [Myxococcales bacterium]
TIRYYEQIGLLPEPARADNGYRVYGARAVDELRFIKRGRGLGFSIADVEALLGLWRDKHRASGDVRALAERHIREIDEKLAELETMRAVLADLVARCHGDERPDCPILESLSSEAPDDCCHHDP